MAVTISGSTGVSGVDGSATAPATTGTDSNSGIFYAADAIKFSTGGTERIALTNSAYPRILQVQNTTTTATGSVSLSTGSQYYDITNLNVSITPSASTSKILLSFHAFGESSTSEYLSSFQVTRAISGGATTEITAPAAGSRLRTLTMLPETYYGGDHSSTPSVGQVSNYLDSPSTTSAITYTVQVRSRTASQTWFYNRTDSDSDTDDNERGVSWITVMEVAA